MSFTPQLTSRLRIILRMYWLSSTTRTHSDWMRDSTSFFDIGAGMRVRRGRMASGSAGAVVCGDATRSWAACGMAKLSPAIRPDAAVGPPGAASDPFRPAPDCDRLCVVDWGAMSAKQYKLVQ